MKSLIQILLLGAVVVLGAVYAGESLLPEPYGMLNAPVQLLGVQDLGIIGPDSVEIGELARMEVDGDIVKWDCIPHILDGQSYGESGRNFVASFREPGVYNVIAAVYTVGTDDGMLEEDVQILHLPITVKGPPEPIVIVPPVYPVDPSVIDQQIVSQVIEWCNGANQRRVKDVANVFAVVSTEIEEGVITTTGEIVNRTAVLNQSINLNGLGSLMNQIQNYLTTQADDGNLVSVKDHLKVWKSIAMGLYQYAGSEY